jgi:hypothetical protein
MKRRESLVLYKSFNTLWLDYLPIIEICICNSSCIEWAMRYVTYDNLLNMLPRISMMT